MPVAVHGLTEEVLGQQFVLEDHPRLVAILNSSHPVRFPANFALPDPFASLLKKDNNRSELVHACIGCAVYLLMVYR